MQFDNIPAKEKINSAVVTCSICHNLTISKRAVRLALDFEPHELTRSVSSTDCSLCAVLLAGICEFEDTTWSIHKSISRVYVYGLTTSNDTLYAEIYFKDDRPKLVIEFHRHDIGKSLAQRPCS